MCQLFCNRPEHGYRYQHEFMKRYRCHQCEVHCRWDEHWFAQALLGRHTPPRNPLAGS